MKKLHVFGLTLLLCIAGTAMQAWAQSNAGQSSPGNSTSDPRQSQVPESQGGQPSQSDPDKNPEARQIEQKIQSAFQADPQSAYSNVSVLATANEIVLSGTVLNKKAKKDAENIASQYASGRKIRNNIQVNTTNPTNAPGPGL